MKTITAELINHYSRIATDCALVAHQLQQGEYESARRGAAVIAQDAFDGEVMVRDELPKELPTAP